MLAKTKLSKLELKILDTIWTRGEASIREAQEAFPEKDRPAYTTVQTMMYRLEAKKAVRRTRKVGNFHVFAAEITRTSAQRKLVDDLLEIFAGEMPTLSNEACNGKKPLVQLETTAANEQGRPA